MKIKNYFLVLTVWAVFFGIAGAVSLHGQAAHLELQISPQSISFHAADPDVEPVIIADRPVHVQMRITGNGNRPWQLTLRADGDLSAWLGFYTISISNIGWTATPTPPFENGTLVANVAQRAAGGNGNLNDMQGDINFTFQNLWTYRAASYSRTVTFILSAP